MTASSDAHGFENSASRAHEVPAGSSDADVDKYVSEYRILSVRQRVLSNELLDIQAQISQVARKTRRSCLLFFCDTLSHHYVQAEMKVQSGAIVRDHMQKELLGAEERMRLLQQEIALIKIQVSNGTLTILMKLTLWHFRSARKMKRLLMRREVSMTCSNADPLSKAVYRCTSN